MTSETVKNWIATNAGIGNCVVASGVSYKDADGVSYTGSTGDAIVELVTAHSLGAFDPTYNYVVIVGGKSYSDFESETGETLTMNDADWAYDNVGWCVGAPTPECTAGRRECVTATSYRVCQADGTWGAPISCQAGQVCQNGICVAAPVEPVPTGNKKCIGNDVYAEYTDGSWRYVSTCSDPYVCVGGVCQLAGEAVEPIGEVPPVVFEFVTGPTTPVAGSIDIFSGPMRMNQAWGPPYRFEMNNVKITNPTQWSVFYAVEIKIWPGSVATCPVTAPLWNGMNRSVSVNTDDQYIRVIELLPGQTTLDVGMEWSKYLDFYVPRSVIGTHSICMYLWANYDSSALRAELEAEDPKYV